MASELKSAYKSADQQKSSHQIYEEEVRKLKNFLEEANQKLRLSHHGEKDKHHLSEAEVKRFKEQIQILQQELETYRSFKDSREKEIEVLKEHLQSERHNIQILRDDNQKLKQGYNQIKD